MSGFILVGLKDIEFRFNILQNKRLLRKTNNFLKFVLVDWLAVQKVVQILVLTLAVI